MHRFVTMLASCRFFYTSNRRVRRWDSRVVILVSWNNVWQGVLTVEPSSRHAPLEPGKLRPTEPGHRDRKTKLQRRLILIVKIAMIIAFATCLGAVPEAGAKPSLFPPTAAVGRIDLERQGYAEYRFARLLKIYAAALYLPPNTTRASLRRPGIPKRLDFYYFRNVDKNRIARTAKSILQRQLSPQLFAQLYPEYAALHETFDDAKRGDRFSVRFDGRTLELHLNGALVSRSTNPALADAYFGLWLHDSPLSDRFRDQLLSGLGGN